MKKLYLFLGKLLNPKVVAVLVIIAQIVKDAPPAGA